MATSISKSVPRSRLNIKYRTRIDGQVVPKELPLRLLVAGDFSGRAKGQSGVTARPLPTLSQRVIYSIGKEGTLEGVLSRARVSLPIPRELAVDRSVSLLGQATVRVERVKSQGDDPDGFQISIKSSLIELAVELKEPPASDANASSSRDEFVAPDSKVYQGEVLSLGSFLIRQTQSQLKLPTSAPGDASAPLGKWTSVASEVETSGSWVSAEPVELSGNVVAPAQLIGEPPGLLEVFGKSLVFFQFEDDLDALLADDGQSAAEFRVRLFIPKAKARRGIQVADMASFSPERVALSVPKIRQLLVVRWLLSQGRSMIGANPVLRAQLKNVLSAEKKRLDARKDIIALLGDKVEAKKQYAQDLLDKTKTLAAAPTDPWGKPLRALVEADEDEPEKRAERKRLERIVTTEWWATITAVDEHLAGSPAPENKEKLNELRKALGEASPWNELVSSVEAMGLEKFVIKGERK